MTDMSVNLIIGKRLRRRRKVLGLTLQQVADRLGVVHQQVQKYEVATHSISAQRLVQLAGVLETSAAAILDGIA